MPSPATNPTATVEILPFSAERAPYFDTINRAWIQDMFVVEEVDDAVLKDPQSHIIDKGGDILFVAVDGEIVGTGALKWAAENALELTKMGVTEAARGKKAGEALLHALIARGLELAPEIFFILTSSKCGSAIHLYEKAGFQHSSHIMQQFGGTYDRCDVALEYPGGPS